MWLNAYVAEEYASPQFANMAEFKKRKEMNKKLNLFIMSGVALKYISPQEGKNISVWKKFVVNTAQNVVNQCNLSNKVVTSPD